MLSTLVAAFLSSAGALALPACALAVPSSNLTTRAKTVSILFPVSPQLKSWTTEPSLPGPSPLSDATFRPHNVLTALPHAYVTAPDGKKSMKAHYPKGSYTFTHAIKGGLSFYAPGPSGVDLTTAKEATFSYDVYFPPGFDFVKGGKLPGLYGGDSESGALSCSGGRRDNGCFSVRFMWRTNGAGELYAYLPPAFNENHAVCNVPPFSTCNDVYGASVGRGSFTFKTGARTTIGQRIKLNDVGKANGEIELFAAGKSMFSVRGLKLRDSSSGRMRGIQMQTFGGE
ncbi:hypothetical protein C8Q74DRAFT_1319764 [Fomes fomentarius]|nr:hypothetical protein C8Q74DRAFT_1319764 [Fomes fomentarius]